MVTVHASTRTQALALYASWEVGDRVCNEIMTDFVDFIFITVENTQVK